MRKDANGIWMHSHPESVCCGLFDSRANCPHKGGNMKASSPLPTDDGDVLREHLNELALRQAVETILVVRANEGRLVGYTIYTAMEIVDKLKALGVLKLDGEEIKPEVDKKAERLKELIAQCEYNLAFAADLSDEKRKELEDSKKQYEQELAHHEASSDRQQQSTQPGSEQGSGSGRSQVSRREADGPLRADTGAVSPEFSQGERVRYAGNSSWVVRDGAGQGSLEVDGPSPSPSLPVSADNTAGRKYVRPASSPIWPEQAAERSSDKTGHEGSSPVRSQESGPSVSQKAHNAQSVASRLHGLAKIREERQALYGDHFLGSGALLMALLGGPVTLTTEADFTRFKNFCQVADKLHRYGVQFSTGGHPDSLDDLAVYAQIQQFIDEVLK